MGLSDFDFYSGFSPERFAMKLGIDPWSADGYKRIFWYRAEDIEATHGSTFEYWPEAIRGDSIPALLLSQPSNLSQFKYYDGYGPNGYPVARWNGSSFMFAGAPLVGGISARNLPFSLFILQRRQFAASASPHLFFLSTGVVSSSMGFTMANDNQPQFYYPASLIQIAQGFRTNEWTILSGHQRTGASHNAYYMRNNVVLVEATAEASNTINPAYTITLNTHDRIIASGTGPAETVRWDLVEVIYIQKDMTREENSELCNMLAKKYSLVLDAPPTLTSQFYYADTPDTGRPELHENLSNPLPADPDGYFIRSFELPTNSASGIVTTTRHLLTDGYYIGLDHTTAVSLRAWVRVSGIVANGQSQIVIFSHMDEPWKGFDKDAFVAYGLKFGTIENDGYGALGLRIACRDVDGYVVPGYEDVVCTGTYQPDTWYRIRLDVLPIGLIEDRINAYVGSGLTDAETWTPVGSITAPSNTDIYREKLWNNRIGFYVTTQNEGASPDSTKYYIDRFQVRTRDV